MSAAVKSTWLRQFVNRPGRTERRIGTIGIFCSTVITPSPDTIQRATNACGVGGVNYGGGSGTIAVSKLATSIRAQLPARFLSRFGVRACAARTACRPHSRSVVSRNRPREAALDGIIRGSPHLGKSKSALRGAGSTGQLDRVLWERQFSLDPGVAGRHCGDDHPPTER
jgi:hypothetical protein